MQNQNDRLCNISSTNSCGGTHSYQKEQTVCELRSDEGIRFFKDGCCGTLRTIDGCGDKCVIERIICASRGEIPRTHLTEL